MKGYGPADKIREWFSDFTGSLNERANKYFKTANGTSGGTLGDNFYKYLEEREFIGVLHDKWLKMIHELGFTSGSKDVDQIDFWSKLDGCTFLKRYDGRETLTAELSSGSPTATFTASRSASNPATYIDSSGVVQLVTSTDTARWTKGYYDSTGFVSAPSLLFEGASTNLLTYSNDFSHADWVKSNITATADQDNAPDGSLTADTLLATAANATILQAETIAENNATFSVWLKRKTGSGNIDLTVDGGSTWTTKTITTSWARYELTQTLVTNPSFGIRIVTDTDAIYAWGAQGETALYPSSFIPTTTASLTRNAEALSYPVDLNFVGGTDGSIVMVYRPVMLPDEQPNSSRKIFVVSIDSSNRWHFQYSSNAGDKITFRTTSGGVNNDADSSVETFSSSRYSLHSVIGTYSTTADASSKKMSLFIDGANETTNADYTAPVGSLPSAFTIQSDPNQAMQLVAIALFNKRLSASEALTIHNLLT